MCVEHHTIIKMPMKMKKIIFKIEQKLIDYLCVKYIDNEFELCDLNVNIFVFLYDIITTINDVK